jgi:hypothetical protein
MSKEAIFKFQENVVKTSLIKVDRNKVYGWSEVIHTDKSGNICTWATLHSDGETHIGIGGVLYVWQRPIRKIYPIAIR